MVTPCKPLSGIAEQPVKDSGVCLVLRQPEKPTHGANGQFMAEERVRLDKE